MALCRIWSMRLWAMALFPQEQPRRQTGSQRNNYDVPVLCMGRPTAAPSIPKDSGTVLAAALTAERYELPRRLQIASLRVTGDKRRT